MGIEKIHAIAVGVAVDKREQLLRALSLYWMKSMFLTLQMMGEFVRLQDNLILF